MCDEVCSCCEKDICKCENALPKTLSDYIKYSMKHRSDSNSDQLKFKGWDIFTNSSGKTYMRKMFNDDFNSIKDHPFDLFGNWGSHQLLDENEFYIKDVLVNEYGIYIKIGVKDA